jgi:rhamnulokinase
MTGTFVDGRLRLEEVHRAPTCAVRINGTLHWDVLGIYRNLLDGLRLAARGRRLLSIGIDGWGCDYGLLDESGTLLGNPVHYRDQRVQLAIPRVQGLVPAPELYARTGIQFLPFNTVYQLAAESASPRFSTARTLLLLPDLFAYWLTGEVGAERTNASTTQLLDARTGGWAIDLMERVGIPPQLFPRICEPGSSRGALSASVLEEIGAAGPVPLVTVGSHDTASAVAAVPAQSGAFAYISSGTWSLVGLELDRPVLTEASRLANFSNERGVDGTVRFLRNVMGQWLLQECLRTWSVQGMDTSLEDLLPAAARLEPLLSVIDVDLPEFAVPGDMPARIAAVCRRTGQSPPADPAATVRCVVDSLALAHQAAIGDAASLSARPVDVVHIVGGGARNQLLCQATADACGLVVEAGPAEAAALGNVLVQARSAGVVDGGLAELRAVARRSVEITRYDPSSGHQARWAEAGERLSRWRKDRVGHRASESGRSR